MIRPFPHQEDAIKSVTESLKTNDRCHILMACGTGKTLTTLWIAQKLKVKTIAIFLPSLALINQFMKEWLKNAPWKNPRVLAICSDETVTDNIEHESLLDEEITFPVSNNSLEILDFLNKKGGDIKLIFCTYQSAWILGNACHGGINLDLGIFDEAHKTAGYGKDLFSYPLHDAIAQSNFSHIWEVLNALSARDSDLNDVIKAIGSPGVTFQNTVMDNYVEFHLSGEKYNILKKLISIKILEKFQQQNSKWDHDDLYNQLLAYKTTHGSFAKMRIKNMRLYKYVQYMKNCYENGSHKIIVKKLQEIGVGLDKNKLDLEALWDAKYQELLDYKKEHGHVNVPQRFGALGKWCAGQRETFKEGKLLPERYEKLKKLRFAFNQIEQEWEDKFIKYKYKISHNLPLGKEIVDWASYQRKSFASKTLPADKIKKLEAINFNFGIYMPVEKNKSALDSKPFIRIKEFYDKHGHINFPSKTHKSLYKYLARLRMKKREGGHIDPLLNAALDNMGVVWDNLRTVDGPKTHITISWQKEVDDLHRALTKGLRLLPKHIEFCKKIYVSKYKARLSLYRKKYLESINFSWELAKDAIIKGQKNIKYKQEKSHAQCNI